MEFKNLILETSDSIACLTINRPQVMNALSVETVLELEKAVNAVRDDDEVLGLIITGAGEKAFVAGADISELQKLDHAGAFEYARRGQRVFWAIENLGKPVIAAVNGFALGGGCELALACHIRIAAENARFGQPEVKLGVIPGFGGTQRLSRLVGKGHAMEICLSGEMVSAGEAENIGLVNHVSPSGKLLEDATDLMKKIIAQGPRAVSLTIKAVNEGLEMPLADGLSLEAELFGECADTKDWREGTTAFLEKRKPDFKGK